MRESHLMAAKNFDMWNTKKKDDQQMAEIKCTVSKIGWLFARSICHKFPNDS